MLALVFFFFFNDTATTEIYTLSLHDALPIFPTTLNAWALRDPDGKVIGAIGILRDMREFEKARAYAESLIKKAPDQMLVPDLDGKIIQANETVLALLGVGPDDLRRHARRPGMS